MNRMVMATLALLAGVAVAVTPSSGATPAGVSTTINNGAGNQFDPHVDGDLVAYTSSVSGNTSIRYFDFATSSDLAISNLLADGSRAMDILSDVSGDTIVFTRIVPGRSSIFSFDTSTAGAAIELDPQSTSMRVAASIGGGTVAWMDSGLTGSNGSSEIIAYDLVAAIATRLTNDGQFDRVPAVSADGLVIAWEKCPSPGNGCEIFSAVRSGGVWTVTQLTSTAESESAPDTNGSIVVYAVTRSSSTTGADVYWTPVAGGSETQLSLSGEERNPNISRNVIAFEHVASGELNADVFAYDLDSNTLYQITSTPNDNETLNDIWVSASGEVRVVWSVVETDQNVYGLTFQLPSVSCPPAGDGSASASGKHKKKHKHWHRHHHKHHDDDDDDDEGDSDGESSAAASCDDPGSRPLLATLQMTRTTGAPNEASTTFSATAGEGLLCVDNGFGGSKATSGSVKLNGKTKVDSDDFKHSVSLVSRDVALSASNTLSGKIAGAPGSAYRVRVYGPESACSTTSPMNVAELQVAGFEPGEIHELATTQATVVGNVHRIEAPRPVLSGVELAEAPAGCSSSGGTATLMGLILLVSLFLRPRAVHTQARRRQR